MKGFIKIGLIALAAIIVGVLIFVFIGVIATPPPTTIAPKDFTATVESRVRQEIIGKPFNEARTAFDELYGFIATESFVTLSTGEKVLSESEAQHCRQLVFNAYTPIFMEYGNEYFQRSSWNDNDITLIGSEAQRLTDLSLAEDSDIKTGLTNFVQYSNDYAEAKRVIRNSASVKTASSAQSYINKARNLNKVPLSNNADLKRGLDEVPSKARNSVLSSLRKRANDLHIRADYVYSQDSYNEWNRDYETLADDISDYSRIFNDTSSLSEATRILSDDDETILARFTNSPEQRPYYE